MLNSFIVGAGFILQQASLDNRTHVTRDGLRRTWRRYCIGDQTNSGNHGGRAWGWLTHELAACPKNVERPL